MTYDITDRTSFNNINSWVNEVKKHASPFVVMYLVGNKCDLEEERAVSTKEGKEFADSLGISFIETSAKERINIDDAFMGLTKQIYDCLPEAEKRPSDPGTNLDLRRRKKKNGCCK